MFKLVSLLYHGVCVVVRNHKGCISNHSNYKGGVTKYRHYGLGGWVWADWQSDTNCSIVNKGALNQTIRWLFNLVFKWLDELN